MKLLHNLKVLEALFCRGSWPWSVKSEILTIVYGEEKGLGKTTVAEDGFKSTRTLGFRANLQSNDKTGTFHPLILPNAKCW